MGISSKRRRERKVKREVKNKVNQRRASNTLPHNPNVSNEMMMKLMMLLNQNGNKSTNEISNSLNQKEMIAGLKNEKFKREREMKVMEEKNKLSMEEMKNAHALEMQKLNEQLQQARNEGLTQDQAFELRKLMSETEQQKRLVKHKNEMYEAELENQGLEGETGKQKRLLEQRKHELEKLKVEHAKATAEGNIETMRKSIKETEEEISQIVDEIDLNNNLKGDYQVFQTVSTQLTACKKAFANVLKQAKEAKSKEAELDVYKNQKLKTVYETAIKAAETYKRRIEELNDKIEIKKHRRDIIQKQKLENVDLDAEDKKMDERLKQVMYEHDDDNGELKLDEQKQPIKIDYPNEYKGVYETSERLNKRIKAKKRGIDSLERAEEMIYNMNNENGRLVNELEALNCVYDDTLCNSKNIELGKKIAEIENIKRLINEKKQQNNDVSKLVRQLKDKENELAVLTSQNDNTEVQPVTPSKFVRIGALNAQITELNGKIKDKHRVNEDTTKLEQRVDDLKNELTMLTSQNDNIVVQPVTPSKFDQLGKLNAQVDDNERKLKMKRLRRDDDDRFEQEINSLE